MVVGCELDLYGFAISFMEYWSQDILPVRAMLCIGPTGYVIATLMYIWYRGSEKQRMEEKKTPARAPHSMFRAGMLDHPDNQDVEMQLPVDPTALKREPFEMKFYHFLPVFRFYVVVKEKEADDIEAIFRVNSLSSFTQL